MILTYPMENEVFGRACEQFESLVSRLIGDEAGQMEHGPIETLIFREGTELLRHLMQAYLDLRTSREPRRYDVTSPEGTPLIHCRPICERQLRRLCVKMAMAFCRGVVLFRLPSGLRMVEFCG